MYRDLREIFWWNEMIKDIAQFMSECANFQQVKFKNQKLGGLSEDIDIPT